MPFKQHIIPPDSILNLAILPIQTALAISDPIPEPAHKLFPTLQIQRALPLKPIVHELPAV